MDSSPTRAWSNAKGLAAAKGHRMTKPKDFKDGTGYCRNCGMIVGVFSMETWPDGEIYWLSDYNMSPCPKPSGIMW